MNTLAPDVGTLVEYGLDSFGKSPQRWRVTSWMREARTPEKNLHQAFAEILFDASQEIDNGNGGKSRFEWCLRNEASHLSLAGISGAIAPIEHCKVIGIVAWSNECMEDARNFANRLGAEHKILF